MFFGQNLNDSVDSLEKYMLLWIVFFVEQTC